MSNTDTAPVSPHPQSSQVDKPSKAGAEPCYRCGGSGIFSQFHGTCYRCGGRGIDPTYRSWILPASWTVEQCIEWDEKRLARNAAATDRRHEREVEKRDAALVEFLAEQDEDIAAQIQAIIDLPYEDKHEIANDIGHKLRRYGSISVGQVELMIKVQAEFDQRREDKANAPAVPPLVEGRRVIEGLVISTKTKDSQYGTQYKMLVEEDDGNRVFGTIPRSIDDVVWDTNRTVRVSFTAAVTVSKDDENFGFYNRPTKATATPLEETA